MLYMLNVSSPIILEKRASYTLGDLEEIDNAASRVKGGDFTAFNTVDKLLRPQVLKMTFKYDLTYYDRDDVLQDMMIEIFMMCFRYDAERGHFMNYALRSIRFKLYNKIVVNPGDWNSWEPLLESTSNKADTENLGSILLKETTEDYLLTVQGLSTLEKYVLKLILERYSIDQMASFLKREEKSITNTVQRLKGKLGDVEGLFDVVDNSSSNRYSILELK